MLNFAANLSFLFPSRPFLDRFSAAEEAGFRGCEFLFPYDFEPEDLKAKLSASKLTQALFNLPPGNWGAGERGLAALPGREAEFAASIECALQYAEVLACRSIHIMTGCSDALSKNCEDVFLSNLERAASRFANAGITALIEPINPIDMPGYFLTEVDQAIEIIKKVGAANLKLQFDCYHRAMMGKDVVEGLVKSAMHLGHIQVAGMPGRNEPNTGTLDYTLIFQKLIDLNYDGWVGCEYHPSRKTRDGLGWRKDWIAF